jgi:hypothetical protein
MGCSPHPVAAINPGHSWGIIGKTGGELSTFKWVHCSTAAAPLQCPLVRRSFSEGWIVSP